MSRRGGYADLPYHMAGLRVRVVRHHDPTMEGVEGLVLEESRRTILVKTASRGYLRVAKHSALFEVRLPSGEHIRVRGEELLGSPEDRVKEYRWRVRSRCLRRRR